MPMNYFQHSRTPSLDDLEANLCHAAWQSFCQRGERGYDLSGSNPTKAGLPIIVPSEAQCREAVSAQYEASPQGLRVAREAVSAYYNREVPAERIQLFASTSEAVGALVKLMCAPGDEVVTCIPTYPLLDCLCSLESVRLLEVPLQDCAGQWAIDFYTLAKTCSEKTRIVIVVSPNNPTGHCIPCAEMAQLVDFCAERGMLLVVDEVFAGYRLNDDPALVKEPSSAAFKHGLVVSLSGLSKVCGLPQHKLGWGVFGGDPQLVEEAMQRLSFITDSTLSVSGWVQRMAPEFLMRHGEFRDTCVARLRANLKILRDISRRDDVQWTVDGVDGGWSVCIRLPGWADDEEIAVFLAENGVRVFPGCFFGYRDTQPTLVVSLITPPDVFETGVARMAELLHQYLGAD